VSGRRVLILRGNGGRDLIARTLASRGALVHYCAAYERHYPELDGDALTRHWQAAGLDSLLITSGELLQRLLELVPSQQQPWLYDRLLVVPSPRVAEMAEAAGFTRITIAQGASNQALTAALELRKME
jgi:uroporphyrinogen-III synthase